jgi:hypothetical protein
MVSPILRKLKVYGVHKGPALVPILRQFYSVSTLTVYFTKNLHPLK